MQKTQRPTYQTSRRSAGLAGPALEPYLAGKRARERKPRGPRRFERSEKRWGGSLVSFHAQTHPLTFIASKILFTPTENAASRYVIFS